MLCDCRISGHTHFFAAAVVVVKMGDQKVRGKVLLNRIPFIDCYANS